jgi:hypothetical protein
MSTAEQRQEWARLAEAATPGEWVASFGVTWDVVVGKLKKVITRTSGINNNTRADAAFIAASRTAVPALLADVDRLTGDNAALSEALDTALAHLKESEAERDALAGQLAKVRLQIEAREKYMNPHVLKALQEGRLYG